MVMDFKETKETLERECSRNAFTRQALVTSALQAINKDIEDQEEVALEYIFKQGSLLTGLNLPPTYWMSAMNIFMQTGWAVEKEQMGDNCSVH